MAWRQQESFARDDFHHNRRYFASNEVEEHQRQRPSSSNNRFQQHLQQYNQHQQYHWTNQGYSDQHQISTEHHRRPQAEGQGRRQKGEKRKSKNELKMTRKKSKKNKPSSVEQHRETSSPRRPSTRISTSSATSSGVKQDDLLDSSTQRSPTRHPTSSTSFAAKPENIIDLTYDEPGGKHKNIPDSGATSVLCPATTTTTVSAATNVWEKVETTTAKLIDIPRKFPMYDDFKLAHVLYCQLRVINMFVVESSTELSVTAFCCFFNEIYHENFFKFEVLRHFLSDVESEKCVSQFVETFCGHFLVQRQSVIHLVGEKNEVSITIYNDLCNLLEKITEFRGIDATPDPTPFEMQILGEEMRNNIGTFGNRHALEFSPMQRITSRAPLPTLKEVGQRVIQIRKKIARSGLMVKFVDVAHQLCNYYNVSNVAMLHVRTPNGRSVTRETDVPEILDIVRLQAKVNAFIQAFVTFRNICTLHELEKDLCKMEEKELFAEFNLGPLAKQLLVYEHFKFPSGKEIPVITTFDVFKSLRKFSHKHYKRRDQEGGEKSKFDLTQFLDHFILNYNFESPFESGVRIQSIALAIQVVGKACSFDSRETKDAIGQFQGKLISDLQAYLKSSAMQIVGDGNYEQGLLDNTLIGQMKGKDFTKAMKLACEMVEKIKHGNIFLENATQQNLFTACDHLKHMINHIARNNFTRRLAILVICVGAWKYMGKDDISLLLEMGFKEAASEIVESEVRKRQQEQSTAKVAESPKSEVKNLIQTCLQKRSTLKFTELLNVENWVINQSQNTNIRSFEDFGHGSFLKFITADKGLRDLVLSNLETQGGQGFSGSQGISREDVKEFVTQCSRKTNSKEEIIKSIKLQFQMKEVSSGLQQFIDQALEQKEEESSAASTFTFLHSLICTSDIDFVTRKDSEDRHFFKLASKQIKEMPALVNISEYTNWDNVFFWKLGGLKECLKELKKRKEFHECVFVEYKLNQFMKVSRMKSTDDFEAAVNDLDSLKMTDSFMSIIVSSGCLKDSPMALMLNYIKSAFLSHSRDVDVNTEDPTNSAILLCTLECFKLLPFPLLVCVFEKLFLSPLEEVYGAQNASSFLLRACEKVPGTKTILHALGYQLAVQEWIDDLEINLLKPKEEEVIGGNIDIVDSKEQEVKIDLTGEESSDTKEDAKDDGIQQTENQVLVENVSESAELLVQDENDTSTVKETPMVVISSEDEAVEVDEETTRLNYCRDLIGEIREKQFGVGVEFTEKGAEMINTYREREGRSLHRLSKELYTKDSHFVLELIQNADDNEYKPENLTVDAEEKPTVVFIVENDKVTVLNNEKGFAEKNIRALCDVGKSTKGIHRKGYIGQKGIGFKSVFRVTDAPEIHSNGFHIQFDASKGPNGYILPDWLANAQDFALESITQNNDKYCWRTQIVLPLKEEMQLEKLTSRFHDIDPSLLMFLNRLHTIVIEDRVSGKVKVMSKEIVGENLVELSENGEKSLWFVVSKEIPIAVRPEVTETCISLAFPIGFEKQIPQKVFAFLPLRSYGFKYIIQADFEVPSSREDIDKDSAWNQYVLNKVPSLVLEAFACFKKHTKFHGLEGVVTFFKYMEHQDHILGIFKRVQVEIMKKLQQEQCLPVLSVDNEATLTWALPSSVIISKYDNKEVLTPKMLKDYLNLMYIHPDFQKRSLSTDVLTSLGVSELSQEQLIEIMKAHVLSVSAGGDIASVSETCRHSLFSWLGKWMNLMAVLLQDRCDFSESTRDTLRSLKMIPITDGSLVSLSEKVIFFPVATESFIQKNNSNSSSSLVVVENDLCIVSRALTADVDELECQHIRRFLKELGVKSMTPGELINDYILPCFKDGSWKEKSSKMKVAYVHYLCEQYHLNPNLYDIEDLKQCVALTTNKGFVCPSQTSIYLTPSYGNQRDLDAKFKACDWTLIGEEYLKFGSSSQSTSHLSSRKWQEFFEKLDLRYFATLQPQVKTLHKSDLPASPWKRNFETWGQTDDDNYIIHDLVCPEFENLLQSGDTRQMEAFAIALDNEWAKYFADHDVTRPTCKLTNTNGDKLKLTYCSFFLKLRFSPWVVASDSSTCQPFGLYRSLENIQSLMADKALYVNLELKNKDFVVCCGLRSEVDFDEFLKEFRKWRLSEGNFKTSLSHVTNIYEYLRRELVRRPVERTELLGGPFIFLPNKGFKNQPYHGDVNLRRVEGKFHKVEHVCWEDPSGLISKEAGPSERRILKDFYFLQEQSLRDYFLHELRVERWPQPVEYLNLVYKIAEKTTLPDTGAMSNVLRLFQVLGSICIKPGMKEMLYEWRMGPTFQDNLTFYQHMQNYHDAEKSGTVGHACKVYEKLLPTNRNRFVGVDAFSSDPTKTIFPPILVFNKSLTAVFVKDEKVDFILAEDICQSLKRSKISNDRLVKSGIDVEFLKVLFFFKACGLRTLTEMYLPPDLATENIAKGCYPWECRLHEATPYVQRFIYDKYPDQYQRLASINFADYLKHSTFFTASRLDVVYRLKGRTDVNIQQKNVAYVEHSVDLTVNANLYVNKEYVDEKDSEDEILREIVKLFVPNNDINLVEELFDFLCSLFIENDKETFMKSRKRIPRLTSSERRWEFPKPPDPYVEPEPEPEDEEMEDVAKAPASHEGGERVMTSWPPRNPGGGGHMVKPESLKKSEGEALEKWGMPEAPSKERIPSIQRGEHADKKEARSTGTSGTPRRSTDDSRGGSSTSSTTPRSRDEQGKSAATTGHGGPCRDSGTENKKGTSGNSYNNTSSSNSRSDRQQSGENKNSEQKEEEKRADEIPVDEQVCEDPSPVDRRNSGSETETEIICATPPRRRSFNSDGTPKGTPSRFNPENFPTYNLAAEYQDVQCDLGADFENRISKQGTDNSNHMIIGKIGEEIVFQHFCTVYKELMESGQVEVRWINQEEETGEPFDFVVTHYNVEESGGEGPPQILPSTVYVEVKTTFGSKEKQFEISSQQLKFALEHGPSFHLYRVSGLATPTEFRLRCLENLASHMDKKAVKMFMVL